MCVCVVVVVVCVCVCVCVGGGGKRHSYDWLGQSFRTENLAIMPKQVHHRAPEGALLASFSKFSGSVMVVLGDSKASCCPKETV